MCTRSCYWKDTSLYCFWLTLNDEPDQARLVQCPVILDIGHSAYRKYYIHDGSMTVCAEIYYT